VYKSDQQANRQTATTSMPNPVKLIQIEYNKNMVIIKFNIGKYNYNTIFYMPLP
jgi:hypothetical protein